MSDAADVAPAKRPPRSAQWLRRRDRILIVAALLLSPYTMSIYSWTAPPPGLPNGRLAPCPRSPNCVCSFPSLPPHFIPPLSFRGSREEAFERLKGVLRTTPGLKIVEEREDYVRAEATSRIMRFVDDVQFQLVPDRRGIQVRSASRVGYSDMGKNRERVEEIRRRFEAAQQATRPE